MRRILTLTILLATACSGSAGNEEKPSGKASGKPSAESTAAPVTAPQPVEVKTFDLHGRAGFDKVNIWEKPDMESTRLGYLRKGQRTMLGDAQFKSDGCPEGWYQLPEGGYVCQGTGMLVGTKPRHIRNAPHPPRVDQLDPYQHGFIRADFTPSYKRIPAQEELWVPPTRFVAGTYAVSIPDDAAAPAEPTAEGEDAPPPATRTVDIVVDAEGNLVFPEGVRFEKLENGEWKLPPGVTIPTEVVPHVDPDKPPEPVEGEEPVKGIDYNRYARKTFPGIREFLMRGFWVSVLRRFRDEATRQYYYETIKGDFVPGNAVHLVRPPECRGYYVMGDNPLPAAIVSSSYAAFFEKRNNRFAGVGPVDRLNVYRVYESEESGGNTWYRIEGDRWLKSSQVEYFDLREPPEGVGENEKWIHVDLSRQTLEAYEGTMPILVTLVSTGLKESEETVTPRGEFRILWKHVTDDMAGSVGDGEEVYMVADVPFVQYIHRNIALHASFWHSKYGAPRSHGCINLSPADARYLFAWTSPQLPANWHGVAATDANPGTRVFISGTTPE